MMLNCISLKAQKSCWKDKSSVARLCKQGSHIELWTSMSYWVITKWTTVSSNTFLQAMDRCTYHGWGQRKLKSAAISAGSMSRNKPHSCLRIALSRQLSREEGGPRLNNGMWLRVGQEAINVAVPAGFFLKWVWRGSVSHKSQWKQLLVSKLRQREGSTTVPASRDTCTVSSDKKELNEQPLNGSCPDAESLGRREKIIHPWLSCAMPFAAVLSPCAGSAGSHIPCWAAYSWRVLKVMTFYPFLIYFLPVFFFSFVFLIQSSPFFTSLIVFSFSL